MTETGTQVSKLGRAKRTAAELKGKLSHNSGATGSEAPLIFEKAELTVSQIKRIQTKLHALESSFVILNFHNWFYHYTSDKEKDKIYENRMKELTFVSKAKELLNMVESKEIDPENSDKIYDPSVKIGRRMLQTVSNYFVKQISAFDKFESDSRVFPDLSYEMTPQSIYEHSAAATLCDQLEQIKQAANRATQHHQETLKNLVLTPVTPDTEIKGSNGGHIIWKTYEAKYVDENKNEHVGKIAVAPKSKWVEAFKQFAPDRPAFKNHRAEQALRELDAVIDSVKAEIKGGRAK